MRNYKKYLAAALAATMVVGSSVVAQAAVSDSQISSSDAIATTSSDASGTVTGNGTVEGNVDKDVFKVVVPTAIQGAGASWNGFNFVMDPQQLITKTNAAKYTTGSNTNAENGFEPNKTLYFINRTNRTLDNTSDFAKITNKSSIDVEISLSAEMKQLNDEIKMSSTETFADEDVSMYMAIKGGIVGQQKETKAIDDTSKKAELTKKIPKADAHAYTTVYDETADDYAYDLVNDDPSYFTSYEFALTGATNGTADWSEVTATPQVEFTWKVEPYEEEAATAPSLPNASKTVNKPAAGIDLTIDVNLGSGAAKANGITSVSFINPTNNSVKNLATDNYSLANGKLTIKAAALTTVTADREYTITFDDTAATTAKFTVKVTN